MAPVGGRRGGFAAPSVRQSSRGRRQPRVTAGRRSGGPAGGPQPVLLLSARAASVPSGAGPVPILGPRVGVPGRAPPRLADRPPRLATGVEQRAVLRAGQGARGALQWAAWRPGRAGRGPCCRNCHRCARWRRERARWRQANSAVGARRMRRRPVRLAASPNRAIISRWMSSVSACPAVRGAGASLPPEADPRAPAYPAQPASPRRPTRPPDRAERWSLRGTPRRTLRSPEQPCC